MRIRSKFRDYYDISLGLGHAADDVLYIRETRELPWHGSLGRHMSCFRVDLAPTVIGFCGRCYGCIWAVGPYDNYAPARPEALCYSLDEVEAFVAAHGDEDSWLARDPRTGRLRWQRGPRVEVASFFGQFGEQQRCPRYLELFREHNVPIFTIEAWRRGLDAPRPRTRLTLNAALRPFEFARIFDPYTAFQELSMYVGGVLNGPVRPVPVPSDEIMAEIKGFDAGSFRKPPSSRKRRKGG